MNAALSNERKMKRSPISQLHDAGIGFDGSPLPRPNLKAGDQIIATKIAFYDHRPEIQSQYVGDLLLVNNPRITGIVGGTYLNNGEEGKNRIGLGGSLRCGTFRLATPNDPGYLATREQWDVIKDKEIKELRNYVHKWHLFVVVIAVTLIGKILL